MRILGIDPAHRNTGIVVANYLNGKLFPIHQETIKTKKIKKMKRGHNDLQDAQKIIIEIHKYIPNVKHTFAEIPGGPQSASASRSGGLIIGVLATIPNLVVYTPQAVKNALEIEFEPTPDLSDYMRKKKIKHDTILWAKERYGLNLTGENSATVIKEEEHEADAMAVLHCALVSGDLEKLYRKHKNED